MPKIQANSRPTLSTTNAYLGNEITITTNRTNSNYTHKITYKYGTATGTIGENIEASVKWTPSVNLANNLTTASSGTAHYIPTTYDGNSNQVGSVYSQTLTLKNTRRHSANSRIGVNR